jgi:hypothetical protein
VRYTRGVYVGYLVENVGKAIACDTDCGATSGQYDVVLYEWKSRFSGGKASAIDGVEDGGGGRVEGGAQRVV